ncbi:major facilitator superfamily protein [Perkinsela sp. CCAP 1560/4]|nr:major facilitator superfamily protein [Perkinsela sp. CCAP 1560/4]|eukprot:KNH09447.1 major facilitator superfamily protein [Perkinsela sp. CCAP 1560/4]
MNEYLDDVMNSIGVGKFQWLLLLLLGISFISDAMELVLITFIVKPLQADFKSSSFILSLIASGIFFGMFCGSMLMGPLSDTIGRKRSFVLCMALVSVGGLLSIASANHWVFLLCRMIVGIGVGGLHISVTLLSEFLPVDGRTLLITLLQGFWSIGVVLEVALAWLLRDSSWRQLVLFTALPAVVATLASVWLPESPLYLVSTKKYREAKKVFQRIARINSCEVQIDTICDENFQKEVRPVRSLYEKLRLIFSTQVYRRTLICLLYLWFVGSFNYCGSLFLSADLDYGKFNHYATILMISLGEIFGKLISYLFLARWSRKTNISLCLLMCMTSLLVITVRDLAPMWLVIASMLTFRIAISMYLTALSVYSPECFPTEIRSSGFGISTSGSRIGGMMSPFIAIMVKSLNYSLSMGIFMASLCLGQLAVYLLPLETKEMSLNRKAGEEKLYKSTLKNEL